MGATKKRIAAGGHTRVLGVVPDKIDLRDRPYTPFVSSAPKARLNPPANLPVLNQKDTQACTGFALATVIHHLLRKARWRNATTRVSPFMIYSMARRYDEFRERVPGRLEDTGSSLRGALKGWFKHGICRQGLWTGLDMPPAAADVNDDWWLDAVNRPLGAYYRVETQSISDMHAALNDAGILYASAMTHPGWDAKPRPGATRRGLWTIPAERMKGYPLGGHAFAIVGYTEAGFIVHNSWGTAWGTRGRAILRYEDWEENAMDCWVAQLGVVTDQHRAIAHATSLRYDAKARRVHLATDRVLQAREISPFIVDMENNGWLSSSGTFRTGEDDLRALVDIHFAEALDKWKPGKTDPVDVAIYAHGGLTSEDDAAQTAAEWIPALYERQIFPVFFMWETDLWSTIRNRFEDLVKKNVPAGGLGDQIMRWWNERIERLLMKPGSIFWDEMKQNAQAMSAHERAGARILFRKCMDNPLFTRLLAERRIRLHLIGHSAGSIAHCHLVEQLRDWRFETVNFMAPAVRVDLFEKTIGQAFRRDAVRRLHEFHLTDNAELQDITCRPILGYGHSLLYLVSRSFESSIDTPILGMEKYFNSVETALPRDRCRVFTAPGPETASTTHGGFDNDPHTRARIIDLIKER